jgi:hypothetical protein
LDAAPRLHASDAAIQWAKDLWGQIQPADWQDLADAGTHSKQHGRVMESILAEYLVRHASFAQPFVNRQLVGLTSAEREARHAQILGIKLDQNSNRIGSLIDAIELASHKTRTLQVLRKLDAAENRHPTDFSRLPLQRWMRQLEESGASIRTVRRPAPGAPHGKTRDLLSIANVRKELSSSLSTIHALTQAGIVSPAVSRSAKQTLYHFTTEQVETLRYQLAQSQREDWYKELGVERPVAVNFLRAGIVRLLIGRTLCSFYDRQDFGQLLDDLRKHATACTAQPSAAWFSLGSPLLWLNHEREVLRMLIERARRGEVDLLWREGEIGLNQVLLPIHILPSLKRASGKQREPASTQNEDLFAACPA